MIVGNCTNHANPDWWFPEYENGRPAESKVLALVETIGKAKALCNTCPVKDECLSEGMSDKDLPFGIWGGKLAGERIASLGKKRSDYGKQTDEGRAMDFYERIKPRLG